MSSRDIAAVPLGTTCPVMSPPFVDRRSTLRLLALGAGLSACKASAAAAAFYQAGQTVRAGITGSTFVRKPSDYPTRRLKDLTGFHLHPEPHRTPFGGFAASGDNGTGFFRVDRRDDRWWLIDPVGARFFSIGLNSIHPDRETRSSRHAFAKRFGSDATWANATTAMLRGYGINTAGAWSDDILLADAARKMAYTPNCAFMATFAKELGSTHPQPGHAGFSHDAIPVFHPDFPDFCERHAADLRATAADPWLIGHFTDNELPLGLRMLDNFLAAPATDQTNIGARRWLAGRNSSFIDDATREAFRAYVIERYYAIVTAAIRRHDPNHLILGTRFYGDEKDSEAAFGAAGRYVDVVSVNVYGEWTPNLSRFQNWSRWSGRPILVSEFYAKGADAGLSNRGGAGWTVATQAERGSFYENFVLGLIESGVCVGWHWHRYMDEPPPEHHDRWNGGSNKGLVASDYTPYFPLAAAMSDLDREALAVASYFDRRGK